MARKKEITVARSFGAVSKAKVFEELIWLVCGKRVKLKPASGSPAMATGQSGAISINFGKCSRGGGCEEKDG